MSVEDMEVEILDTEFVEGISGWNIEIIASASVGGVEPEFEYTIQPLEGGEAKVGQTDTLRPLDGGRVVNIHEFLLRVDETSSGTVGVQIKDHEHINDTVEYDSTGLDWGIFNGDDPPDEWDMSVECVSGPPSEVTVGETFTVEFEVTNETNDTQQYTLTVLDSGTVLDETDSAAQSGDTRTHSFTIEAQSTGSITPAGEVSER